MEFDEILQALKEKIYRPVAPLSVVCAVTDEPVAFAQRESLVYRALEIGQRWGRLWDCGWMHMQGKLPDGLSAACAALRIDVSGEGCIYSADGKPLRGITNVDSEYDRAHGLPGKRVVRFSELGLTDAVDIWLDCGCNDLFGKDCGGVLRQAEIVVCDERLRSLFYDAWVLLDGYKEQPQTLNGALEELFARIEREEYAAARDVAAAALAAGTDDRTTYTAVGHAHLDLAWLWPIRETRRKAARTFATAMRLLERYPHYVAGFSQPQQFEWIRQEHPALYDEIKKWAAAGRLEVQGAMWVEPDLNVPSGESLIRQCMAGRRFFGEQFGVRPDIAHLPDVFGFNGALPQILRGCGVDKLVTIKISWNRYNRFPHTSFYWAGIDGTEVLVHMPPEGTYNSAAAPHCLRKAQALNREKDRVENALMLYGIGDGGGGPGPEHLERLARLGGLPGLPRAQSGGEAEFFRRLEGERDKLPRYSGELYLEKHQGTYTTRLYNKRHNRRMETLLGDAEYFACCAYVRDRKPYPREQLDALWKETMLYQFHDILPGSSIDRVYRECETRYPVMESELNELIASRTPCTGRAGLCGVLRPVGCPPAAAVNGRTLSFGDIHASVGDDGRLSLTRGGKTYGLDGFNVWAVYEDGGDGWDYGDGYKERRTGVFRLDEAIAGDGITLRFSYGASSITQYISAGRSGKTLRVHTEIDWQERDKLLVNEFQHTVDAKEITCGIPCGAIRRPLNGTDPISRAMTEFCAQRYVDITGRAGGFSLLNNGIYGYSADGNVLRMHVLRNAAYPSRYADTGRHAFTYEVYLHKEAFADCDAPYLADELNANAYACLPDDLFRLDGRALLGCVKLSEDGRYVVVRVYEPSGKPARVAVQPQFACGEVLWSRLDETDRKPGGTAFELRPFEIKTLLFGVEEI